MSNYVCIGKQLLTVKNNKTMELVCLQKEEDFGKMASKMPVIAINNSNKDLEFGKPYGCKVYFNKNGKFNNLYKVGDPEVDKPEQKAKA